MKKSSQDRLANLLIEAIAKGMANPYQATDDDLPDMMWPDIEEKFWSELERKLYAKV